MLKSRDVKVPLDVPARSKRAYISNYLKITKSTGRLMLFAGDQKVEHLNRDFYGKGISPDDAEPEHLFRIASKARIGVFASQLGLISSYGRDYPDVTYLVKLNSKTDIVPTRQKDPISLAWYDIAQISDFSERSGLEIVGVGYTLYLGSENEAVQLREAAQSIHEAHKHGLVFVLWVYPRGKAVKNERDISMIAGATGVAACLGSDFVKVSFPEGKNPSRDFRNAVLAAGRTGVVCAGGSAKSPKTFLKELYDQIHISGASGNATGRNIHQKSLKEAVAMCNAISAITLDDTDVEEALRIYQDA